MHWSEEIAKKVIAQNPDKEEYVCAAGVSPSGSVHIGNFRDLATSYMVVKALEKQGKKARLLISWDDYDRCRKIPKNVQDVVGNDYDKYIGCPYVDIPDPWGCHENYAKHFEDEFLKGIAPFGIQLDCRFQADLYRSGAYTDAILESIQKRGEIFEILDSFKTKDKSKSEEELKAEHDAEKAAYSPVSIFSSCCRSINCLCVCTRLSLTGFIVEIYTTLYVFGFYIILSKVNKHFTCFKCYLTVKFVCHN